MATMLDGPVGVVRPGSWWRTQRVTNHARDQARVYQLLASIPVAQGGKQGVWSGPLLTGPDGSCAPLLADAIWDFQRHWKEVRRVFKNIDGVVDPGGNTLRKLNELAGEPVLPPAPPIPPPPPEPPATFVVRDVRLEGWRPSGDVLEVNGDTPLQWIVDNIVERGRRTGGNLVVKIMAHGLPGFVQCGKGGLRHPTLTDDAYIHYRIAKNAYVGPRWHGLSITDLPSLARVAGSLRRLELHSCLVARMGTCHEANGHTCYDGNEFCYKLAQTIRADVMASLHLQWYWLGTKQAGNGMNFGGWNGTVITWGPAGNIVDTIQHPYQDKDGPPARASTRAGSPAALRTRAATPLRPFRR